MSSSEVTINDVVQENKKLSQENEELRYQINSLKNQFQQALKVNSTLEQSFQKNAELSKQLSESEALNDDLSKRLDIANKNCSELESKVKMLMSTSQTVPNYIPNNNNKTFSEELNKLQNQIKEYNEQIINFKNQLTYEQNRRKSLESDISTIYKTASKYFGKAANSISSLVELFQRPRPEFPNNNFIKGNVIYSQNDDIDAIVYKLKKKVRKWKARFHEEHSIRVQLEHMEPCVHYVEKPCDEYNLQINELKNTNNGLLSQIHQLKEENTKLTTQNSQQASQIKILTMQHDSYKTEDSPIYAQKISALHSELASERLSNEKLKCKLDNYTSKYRESEKILQDAQLQIQVLTLKNQNLNEQNIAYKRDNEELAATLKASEKKRKKVESEQKKHDLEVDKSMYELNRLNNDINVLQREKNKLENHIQLQQDEIEKLYKERQNLSEDANNYKQRFEIADKKCASLSEKKTSLEKQLAESISQIQDLTIKKNSAINELQQVPELIALASVNISDLPSDLNEIIESIVKNMTLPLPSKLNTLLNSINSYYRSKIVKIEKEHRQTFGDNETDSIKFKNLVQFLNKRFSNLHIDFSHLDSNDDYKESFTKYISDLIMQVESLTMKEKEISDLHMKLFIELGTDTLENSVTKAAKLKKSLILAKDKLRYAKECLNEQRMEFENRENESKEALKMIEKEFEEANKAALSLENQCTQKEAEIKSLKNDFKKAIKSMKDEYRRKKDNIKRSFEEKIQSVYNEHEIKVKDLESKLGSDRVNNEKQDIELRTIVKSLEEDVSRISSENETLRHENEDLKGQNDSLNEKIRLNQEKIRDLNECIEDVTTKYKEKLANKKEQYESFHAQMVAQMQSLTQESTRSITDFRNTIENLQKENERLLVEKEELVLTVRKQETKMNLAINENQRAHKQLEIQNRAHVHSLETDYRSKLEELQQEKLRMFSTIKMILSPLLATGEYLEESNMADILTNIKSRYDVMLKRDSFRSKNPVVLEQRNYDNFPSKVNY